MGELFRKSVFAGMLISLGCLVNLKVGGYVGAVLFAFGLMSVVYYGLPLYTGRAGFCATVKDLKTLPMILLGNVLGTSILGVLSFAFMPELVQAAHGIVSSRIASSIPRALFLSFLCGFVMTTVVTFARRDDHKMLPLLFGIPLFILSGFWHSIADAFYYVVSMKFSVDVLWIYPVTVLGNFVGCTVYNLLVSKSVLLKCA